MYERERERERDGNRVRETQNSVDFPVSLLFAGNEEKCMNTTNYKMTII